MILVALTISPVNLPETFNRLFIFVAYAIVAKIQGTEGMSVSQAITSLAALNLLATPLASLLSSIPVGWAALGCFDRIQNFLAEQSREDYRKNSARSFAESSDPTSSSNAFELQSMSASHPESGIAVQSGTFGWSDSNPNIVKDVSTGIGSDAKLVILVGPVGCGKSTLLKALLGETPSQAGTLSIPFAEIAYCDQTPWTINGSIRDNIIVDAEFDQVWYRTVIQACALDIDLQNLPDGDSTMVGSKGLKLSGGQKQRLVNADSSAIRETRN
jgi:ABC-type multidrug transport system fused ATPase/permease subunit